MPELSTDKRKAYGKKVTLALLSSSRILITLELFLGKSELRLTGGMNFRLLLTWAGGVHQPYFWTRPLLTCEIGLRGFHPRPPDEVRDGTSPRSRMKFWNLDDPMQFPRLLAIKGLVRGGK